MSECAMPLAFQCNERLEPNGVYHQVSLYLGFSSHTPTELQHTPSNVCTSLGKMPEQGSPNSHTARLNVLAVEEFSSPFLQAVLPTCASHRPRATSGGG